MFRIDTPNKSVDLFGTGKHGFRDGNKALAIAPTELSAAQQNALQEELAGIVEFAGLALNKANNGQVLEALQRLIDAQSGNYALDTGVANAYVIALSPPITAYNDGLTVRMKIANANNGASTLNAGGGVVALVNDLGSALADKDLSVGMVITAVYDSASNKFIITSSVTSSDFIMQAGAGAVYRTTQLKLREFVSDADFGAIGDGTTDDTVALANFFNSANSNPGVPHLVRPLRYAISAQLPTINVSNVIVRGAGSATHDVGATIQSGTVFKAISSMSVMQEISAVSGASNRKLTNLTFTGIGYDCNSLADTGLRVISLKDCVIDISCVNAVLNGLVLDVIQSYGGVLGEAADLQRCNIRYVGRQVEHATGVSMRVRGTAPANVSMNTIYADVVHKDSVAIVEEDADNNDWMFCRTYKTAAGSAINGVEWHGAATVACCREERFHFLTSNLPARAYGTATYAVPATNIRIFTIDSGNATPAPTVGAGASVYWNKSFTPFGDIPWKDFTGVVTSTAGALGAGATANIHYHERGKICHFELVCDIPDNGTGSGGIIVTMPFAEGIAKNWIVHGKATAISGKALCGVIGAGLSTIIIRNYDASYPAVAGEKLIMSGFYEIP